MGSSGRLLYVSLLMCVCGTITGHSLHTAGPCLVNTGKVSFHCSHKNLTKIPEDIWTNVTKLDLSHNGLTLNHPETLRALQRFEQLVYLNVSANYLPLLVRGSLSSLPSLEVLDLSRCQLAEVESGAFEGLPRLQKLFLGHNRLRGSVAAALKEFRGVLYFVDLQDNSRFSPFDGSKREQRVIRFKGSKIQHGHKHTHEVFKEKLVIGKLNHRKLLAEDPHALISPSTPTMTLNVTLGVVPSHNWKVVVGVIVTAIILSITFAVAAKCHLFRQYITSYRHSRFTNIDSMSQCDQDVYEVGFAQHRGAATIENGIGDNYEDEEDEDDDGFIEDNYIQPSERERASRAAEHHEKEEVDNDLEDELEFTIG